MNRKYFADCYHIAYIDSCFKGELERPYYRIENIYGLECFDDKGPLRYDFDFYARSVCAYLNKLPKGGTKHYIDEQFKNEIIKANNPYIEYHI